MQTHTYTPSEARSRRQGPATANPLRTLKAKPKKHHGKVRSSLCSLPPRSARPHLPAQGALPSSQAQSEADEQHGRAAVPGRSRPVPDVVLARERNFDLFQPNVQNFPFCLLVLVFFFFFFSPISQKLSHSLQRCASSPAELIPQKQNSTKLLAIPRAIIRKKLVLITKSQIAVVLTSGRSNRNQTSISEQLAINCQQLKSKPGAHKGSV